MPLEELGQGCLEMLFRVVAEALKDVFWAGMQYFGSALVWLLTFGRVWLMIRHENTAGCLGSLVFFGTLVLFLAT